MSKKIVLAGACRTAIGKMGGALSNTPAADLGAIVIKEALNRAGVKPEQVDEVLMGCVIQAAQGQNVARQASIKAGLPIEVPAVTLNVVCGSGLNCVNQAAAMIKAGMADIVVAGGMENMSMAPYALTKARFGYRMNDAKIIDTMTNDALTDAFNHYHMMITAENICDKYGLTREELDEFAANSQQKTEKAQNEGKFDDEIVPGLTFDRPYLLAMANAGLRRGMDGKIHGTNGSQFFITTVPTEWLNGHHTIFGEVADDESKAVVDKLDSVATDRSDAPLEPVGITSIEVLK